jgi:hypothetical protein
MDKRELKKAEEHILKFTKKYQELGGAPLIASVAIVNPEDGSASDFGLVGTLPLLEIKTANSKRDISVTFSSSQLENEKLLHKLSTNL